MRSFRIVSIVEIDAPPEIVSSFRSSFEAQYAFDATSRDIVTSSSQKRYDQPSAVDSRLWKDYNNRTKLISILMRITGGFEASGSSIPIDRSRTRFEHSITFFGLIPCFLANMWSSDVVDSLNRINNRLKLLAEDSWKH